MKNKKVLYAWIVAGVMGLSLVGCSASGNSQASSNSTVASSSGEAAKPVSYPIQTEETLTYWLVTPTTLKTNIQDVPFYQALQEQVGVKINFIEVPASSASETFNLLLASGELPDIIEYNWLKDVPGGPQQALSDGYILPLNDLLESDAPNLRSYLDANPDVDKQVKTDDGTYYAFPYLKEVGGRTTQWAGPIIRKDWLEELNLDVPVTIDDWHNVLTQFKEKKGATAPLLLPSDSSALQGFLNGAFVGAFGTIRDFYVDDNGKVQYGPLQPTYKEFLTTMSEWKKEGLLGKNFSQTDAAALDNGMITGESGATVYSGAVADKWELALSKEDPDAKFVYAPYPVLNKGDTPQFGQEAWPYGANASAAITKDCKNPKLAAQVLDYAYSKAGSLLYNYGTEGKSYTLENDKPIYSDLITNNPDKLSYVEALSLYSHVVNSGPYIQRRDAFAQMSVEDPDHSYDTWKTDNLKHVLPPLTLSTEESKEYAKIISDVNTLVDETSLKIILGTQSPDTYDSFVETLKSLNIQRAIEIQQAAYDRYQKR